MNPLDKSKQEIVERYMPLAIRLGREFAGRSGVEVAEAVAVAFLGLCEAGSRFDGGRSGGFVAMARKRIKSRLMDWAAFHWIRPGRRESLPGDMDLFPAPESPCSDPATVALAELILSESSPKRRAAFVAIMSTDSYQSAASMPGMSLARIKNHLHEAREEYRRQ